MWHQANRSNNLNEPDILWDEIEYMGNGVSEYDGTAGPADDDIDAALARDIEALLEEEFSLADKDDKDMDEQDYAA